MSEKMETIKNGGNVELDGITVINNVSFSEKVKEENETKTEDTVVNVEEKTKDLPAEESTSNKINSSLDTPVVPIPTPVEEPIIPTIDNLIPKETTFSSTIIPPVSLDNSVSTTTVPEMPQTESFGTFNSKYDYPQNDFGNNEFGSYQNNFDSYTTSQNFYGQPSVSSKVPSDIENSLNSIRSGYLKIVEENDNLKNEISKVKSENNNLKNENLGLQKDNAAMKAQIINMRDRLLGMFGIPGNVIGQQNFNDELNNDDIKKVA